MFTGIIEETGTIERISKKADSMELLIRAVKVLEGTQIGDSICTNGVCLTVTSVQPNTFTADVMTASLQSTNLGKLKHGSIVNLERALSLNTRLGGHIVNGHIDGTGEIIKIEDQGIARLIRIKTSNDILKYMIKKGSVAVDGISLTIQDLDSESFQVSIIPHTKTQTNLHTKKSGDTVNLEADMLAKYTERLLSFRQTHTDEKKNDLDMNYLIKQGFIS